VSGAPYLIRLFDFAIFLFSLSFVVVSAWVQIFFALRVCALGRSPLWTAVTVVIVTVRRQVCSGRRDLTLATWHALHTPDFLGSGGRRYCHGRQSRFNTSNPRSMGSIVFMTFHAIQFAYIHDVEETRGLQKIVVVSALPSHTSPSGYYISERGSMVTRWGWPGVRSPTS
jgi:hypothetical protein